MRPDHPALLPLPPRSPPRPVAAEASAARDKSGGRGSEQGGRPRARREAPEPYSGAERQNSRLPRATLVSELISAV